MHAGTAHRWSPTEAREQAESRRAATLAKAAAGGRALGNLVVTAMAVIACLMAAVALEGEPRQQQQLERLR